MGPVWDTKICSVCNGEPQNACRRKGKKKPSFSYKFLRQRCYSALQSIGAPPRNIPPVSTTAIGGCLDGKCAKEPVISV